MFAGRNVDYRPIYLFVLAKKKKLNSNLELFGTNQRRKGTNGLFLEYFKLKTVDCN